MPTYPRRSYGSRALAAWRMRALERELGPDHPATLAARGRWRALAGHVPQRFVHPTPEVVAWLRESGRAGDYNRSARRAAATSIPGSQAGAGGVL